MDPRMMLAQSLMMRQPTAATGLAGGISNALSPIAGAFLARSSQNRQEKRRAAETSAMGRLLRAAEEAKAGGTDPMAAMSGILEANRGEPGYEAAERALMERRLSSALAPAPKRETAKDVTGRLRYVDTEEPVFPSVTPPAEPPKTRKFQRGGEVITQEWDPKAGAFVEIARGPKTAGVEVNVGPSGVDYGDPPKDMTWARDDSGEIVLQADPNTGYMSPVAVPIAGGPVEMERAEAAEKAAGREALEQRTSDIVTQDIDRVFQIMDESPFPVTGLFGKVGSYVPGTPQHDVAQALQSVKAATSFDRLQEMRASSPTGGALGQVSNVEIGLLQSAMGSLEQSQTADQFRRNLQRVRDIYSEIVNPQISDLSDEQLLKIDDPGRLSLEDLREYTKRLEAMADG